MSHSFPPPPIKPFNRLQASDGLLINAERWDLAHDYQCQRQNFHYQSMNQPGIVCGLGVRVIPAPSTVKAEYRDKRWVQIQPGLAIDLAGNVIVVPNTIDFRFATEVADAEPVTVYLVVSFVDPVDLHRDGQNDIIQETFRIDEKTKPPEDSEVELCRLLLQPGPVSITQPSDVFSPGYNNIDMRHRAQVQARPQALVRMAQVSHADPEHARSFVKLWDLIRSLEGHHSSLRGADELGQVGIEDNIQEYDLLYLTGKQTLSLNQPELESLKSYFNTGGILLVDAPLDGTALIESTQTLAQELKYPLKPLEEVNWHHDLRTSPFSFGALPLVNQQPIKLFLGGGIILIVGDLASSWGPDRALTLSRDAIRSAQELGINILQYAWEKRHLLGLQ